MKVSNSAGSVTIPTTVIVVAGSGNPDSTTDPGSHSHPDAPAEREQLSGCSLRLEPVVDL